MQQISAADLQQLLRLDLNVARHILRQKQLRDFELDQLEGFGDGEDTIGPQLFALDTLERTLLKKLEPEKSEAADQAALTKWFQKNTECGSWSWKPKSELDEILLNEVKDVIESYFFQGPDLSLTFLEIIEGMDQGPGKSLGSESNDFYSKFFTSCLTATSDNLLAMYQEAVRSMPETAWFNGEFHRRTRMGTRIVAGSKLTFVPKYAEISRVICVEPLANMAFQKGISAVLKKLLLRRTGISLSDQPTKNQRLAQIGSESGLYGTIDLESASDSISTGLVDMLFPEHVVRWLKMARSPVTTLPDGRTVELQMISSMGNDFTFPLQTMIFAAVVLACYRVLGIKPKNPSVGVQFTTMDPSSESGVKAWRSASQRLGNYGVFGDDIIVRREAYDSVVNLLELFGFSVNRTKSFNEGLFRESCGTDWHSGHNVRGVYAKKLRTEQEVYSLINRLMRWCARHQVRLPSVFAYLRSRVEFNPIPLSEQDTYGIQVPWRLLPGEAFGRTENGLVRFHCQVTTVKSFCVYDESRHEIPGFWENPEGLLVASLAGKLRKGRITPRLESVSTRQKAITVPCWDTFVAARTEMPEFAAAHEQLVLETFFEDLEGEGRRQLCARLRESERRYLANLAKKKAKERKKAANRRMADASPIDE